MTVGLVQDDIYSQEFRLNYATEKWQGLVGLYYNYKNRGRPQRGSQDHITTYDGDSDSLFESYSVFAEADYRVSEHWTFTLGGRYEQADSQIEDLATGVKESGSENAFVGKAGIRYTFDENHVIGFTFSQAYRPGGVVVPTDQFDPYDPEFVDNYELSYRGRFGDGKLAINANLFYLDWTDLQGFVFDENFNFSLENAGDADSHGGELELSLYPLEGLEIYTAIGLAKGTYKEYRSGLGNFDGNEFEDAPQENYIIGFDYNWGSFSLGANAEYTGTYFANVQNTQEIDSRTVIDLTANYYPTDNITLTFYADNLLDERYADGTGFSRALVPGGPSVQPTGTLGAPRVIGLRAGFEF